MSNTTMIWGAVGLGAVLLIALWITYDQDRMPIDGEMMGQSEETMDTSDDMNDELTEAEQEEAELATARAEAQADLIALRTRVAADATYENAEEELIEIRTNLESAYADASVSAQNEWERIEAGFAQTEDALREGTGNVLQFFAELALILEADVRLDAEAE